MERRWEIVINRGGAREGEMKEREDIIRNKGSSHEIRENCLRVTSFHWDIVFPSIHVSLSLSYIIYIYIYTRFPLRTCRVKINMVYNNFDKIVYFFPSRRRGEGTINEVEEFRRSVIKFILFVSWRYILSSPFLSLLLFF